MQKPSNASRSAQFAKVIAALAGVALLTPVAPSFADPPPWAPAHGYREKQKHKNKHRRGYRRDDTVVVRTPDFIRLPDLGLGNCNREALGMVLGAGVGAAAGSQIGKGSGNTAAVIAGTILGGIIGGSIGRSMDRVDTQCVGQVLEHVPTGRQVEWRNPDDGTRYSATPTRTYRTDGRYCREYTATAVVAGSPQRVTGKACRNEDGSWQIVS